jgi:hypothetical protein
MKKIMSLALVATMAVAGLGVTAGTGDARERGDHRGRGGDDFNFTLQFGGSPYYGQRYYQPYYEPYYAPPPPRRAYRGGMNAHVAWCYDRYRSYRAYDNTYQPLRGPRRECRSPYFG